MDTAIKITEIAANGFRFKCRTCGTENTGDIVLFMHGFPESSIMWTEPMQVLAQKGYRCYAPDQRGYSAGARPEGIENYTRPKLVSDIVAIADAIGTPKFHLVAHDWGGTIAWGFVMRYPERVISFSVLSMPHSVAFSEGIDILPQQKKLSQYIKEYSVVGEAEKNVQANDYALLRERWEGFPQEDIDDYMTIFGDPKGLTATLSWYRASRLVTEEEKKLPKPDYNIYVPTLLIWGRYDAAIGPYAADETEKYMRHYYRYIEIRGDHWLIQKHPQLCISEITQHIEKFTK